VDVPFANVTMQAGLWLTGLVQTIGVTGAKDDRNAGGFDILVNIQGRDLSATCGPTAKTLTG